jgi:hypothetical protein
VDERSKALGDIEAGSRAAFENRLTNLTDHPIKLVGAQTSCSCMVVENLPTTIQPLQTRSIPIGVEVPKADSGVATGSVRLFTDDPEIPELGLAYSARVVTPRVPLASRSR